MGLFEARTETGGGGKATRELDHAGERLNIAFGAERLGFIGLKAPIATLIALAVLVVLAVIGISRLTVDDSLSELFRSETPEFKQFEKESKLFPSNEYDVLVVVEGKDLLGRKQIGALRQLATDLAARRWRQRPYFDLFRATAGAAWRVAGAGISRRAAGRGRLRRAGDEAARQ
jgi:hypothetical protein